MNLFFGAALVVSLTLVALGVGMFIAERQFWKRRIESDRAAAKSALFIAAAECALFRRPDRAA